MFQDETLTCRDCGRQFVFTAGEQEFYRERGMSEPKRCETCREARKPNRDGGNGAKDGGGRVERAKREMDALFKPAKK